MGLRAERVSVAAVVLDGCGVTWLQAATWRSSARNNCTITWHYTALRRARRQRKGLSMERKGCTEGRTQTNAFRNTDDTAAGTFPSSICPCYQPHCSVSKLPAPTAQCYMSCHKTSTHSWGKTPVRITQVSFFSSNSTGDQQSVYKVHYEPGTITGEH
jgi:hypothetical protein